MAAAPQIFKKERKEMKIKATYTIEKEYNYDLDEWLKDNPNLNEKEFELWE